jgi:hypothetical protein
MVRPLGAFKMTNVDPLSSLQAAVNKLFLGSGKPGAEVRRNQITEFWNEAFAAIAGLAEEAGADPLVIEHALPYAKECTDDAFMDVIEDEERSAPNFNQPYSTMRVHNGKVVG